MRPRCDRPSSSEPHVPDAKPCLVTGGTGFLGRHLVHALEQRLIRVLTISRKAGCNGIVADLTVPGFRLPRADFGSVYHLAGLAHRTPGRDAQPSEFFRVNVDGTRQILAALSAGPRPPDAFVLISTVAVYGVEEGELLDENTPRRADDPYGRSKCEAEDLVQEWGGVSGVRVGIVRLPLVVGKDAPGNFGAMVRAIRSGWYCGIEPGSARRSMVLATDVAAILPVVAETGGVFHLTDGYHPCFAELEDALARTCGRTPPFRIPESLARRGARVGDAIEYCLRIRVPFTTRTFRKMTSTLTFSDRKARAQLGWSPRSVLNELDAIMDGPCRS